MRALRCEERELRSALPETCALLCPDVYDVTDGNSPVHTVPARGLDGTRGGIGFIPSRHPRECPAREKSLKKRKKK